VRARTSTPRALLAVRHELGLDRSLGYQYVHWVSGVVRGDFGKSYYSQFPVTTLISARVAPTFQLASVSLLLGLLIAVAGGDDRCDLAEPLLRLRTLCIHRGRDGDALVRQRDPS